MVQGYSSVESRGRESSIADEKLGVLAFSEIREVRWSRNSKVLR